MKLFVNSLLATFFVASVFSQGNDIVVFTMESEPFYVVLNGVRQNEHPETNVRIENVNGEFHRLRIIFDNADYAPVDQSINFFEKDSEVKVEMIFRKNRFRARFLGEAKKEKNEAQVAVNYATEEGSSNSPVQTKSAEPNRSSSSVKVGGNSTESKQSSSQTSVKIEVSESGIKKEININNKELDENWETTVQQTAKETEVEENYTYLPNGSMCQRPSLSQKDYLNFRYAIEEENMFNREKFIVQFFSENCMTAAQVAGIVQMEYSTVKPYEVAKSGYRHTWDTENYDVVISSLKSENDRKKLINFLGIGQEGGAVEQPEIEQSKIPVEAVPVETPAQSLVEGYSGCVNCSFNQLVDAEAIKAAADEKSFAADKMEVIRVNSQQKCYSVEDVKLIAETFTHESDKLDFLEFAYMNTYDAGNYYAVFNGLTHSASKERIGNFLLGQQQPRFGEVETADNNKAIKSYSGKAGSKLPIINQDVFMKTMNNQVFQKDKMLVIDLALANYSMTTEQFMDVAQAAFTSEKDILEFAKKAYPNIYDRENFHQVKSILSFNSSKKEFDELIGK